MQPSFAAGSALRLIRLYQRHLSPRKGYDCAYRVLHGGSGCSGVGYRLIRRYGLIRGYGALRRRFAHCRAARAQLYKRAVGAAYYQRGDCDLPLPADCGHADVGDCTNRIDTRFLADWLGCCDCGGLDHRKSTPSDGV
ncbi:putative component of membrane protein insertase Oxa1/YidC/SpoIIIJ protein YidD [Neisseria sp. HSC-16F19]|nr:membrane protein insertion efficiency factor YidD [Neisseria sp. HSC-16F19]MCP2040581.1 putative component of membrane protein insertase Oxa1/YidC/SpoIIIJ protein YidD [Neisseria sp. HSC-16F19]